MGVAILKSGLLPEEGLIIFIDLQKAQRSLVLQNELHLLYLLTPVSMPEIRVNWDLYQAIYKNLSPIEDKICERIEIDESYLVMASHSNAVDNNGVMAIKQSEMPTLNKGDANYEFMEVNKTLIKDLKHVRFYLTLVLKDLITEPDVKKVARFYSVSEGALLMLK